MEIHGLRRQRGDAVAAAGGRLPLSRAEATSSIEIRQVLDAAEDVRIDGFALDAPALRRFYQARGFKPAWEPDNGGTERVAALIAALARAEDHGLDPRDYHLDGIRDRFDRANERAAAEREALLTDAFSRYATQVRSGRLDRSRWSLTGASRRPDSIRSSRWRARSVSREPSRPCATPCRRPPLLRDFRSGKAHAIDRRLLDLLVVLNDRLDSGEPFEVISGYRSPATNAMLVRTTGGVSATSLHVDGMAIDIRVSGRPLARVRDAAMALRGGGVGYYPASNFVHVDVGRIRSW